MAPLVYEVARYDTLSYPTMPGAPEISFKRAVLTVRPRTGIEVEVTLDSLQATDESRPASSAADSVLHTRWQASLSPSGTQGLLRGGSPAILAGQIEAIVRLLLPQLPPNGLREEDRWVDSSTYRVRLDAFDAFESVTRSSEGAPAPNGVAVEATEQLTRTGTGAQAGQTMTLKGSGLRRVKYEFVRDGWLDNLVARDSVDLVVTVNPDAQTIPVRWRSTLTARLRGPIQH
jgi:hypothetical protein